MEKQTCCQRTDQTPAEVDKTTAVVSDDELFEKIDDFFICLMYDEIDENDAFLGFSDAEIERIKKLAESDEPHSQAILAMSDDNTDIEALIESAEKNYDMAQILVFSICYSDDDYYEYIERAFDCLKLAAEHGNALAQDYLGDCYYRGRVVAQNYNEAVKWYRKAAEHGLKSAQDHLGVWYCDGECIAHNHDEGVKWYRKAANRGSASAQGFLGACYYFGRDVAQSYNEAVKWYKKAAEQGLAFAQDSLGDCYYTGNGVEEDKEEAAKWYKKAAEQGLASAQDHLGDCYYCGKSASQNYNEAIIRHRKATEQGLKSAKEKSAILESDN